MSRITVMGRILIIGAKGMLGRDLGRVLSSTFSSEKIFLWDIDEIDICREGDTIAKIEDLKPELVINLAAYTDVDGCETNETKAFSINAEGMRHVALGAKRCGAKVAYLSTDYIFDGEKKSPYVEEDLACPLNVYGRSKLKGEEYLKGCVENYLIIRTQWLYGKHGKNFVDTILEKAREKKLLTIVDDQIGSPTCTVDLSRAISNLLQSDARGVFHVANDSSCSWYTFGRRILEFSGIDHVEVVPISSEKLGRPAKRPRNSVFSCEKFRAKTGTILRPWTEALKDYLSARGAIASK